MENRESVGEYEYVRVVRVRPRPSVRCVLGDSVSAFRVELRLLLLSLPPLFLFLSSMLYIIQLASFDLVA